MPYCDIDEHVSLHYITNTPNGDAAGLDPLKPTIVLLPTIFGAATMWLREHFKDPRLSQHYNLIAFDLRNMGLTKAPLEPKRDVWVDAADLAVAHEVLHIPPCHVFAVAAVSGGTGLRFAALFPDKCLSLCLCSPPPQPESAPHSVEQGFLETLRTWCFPQGLEDVERACEAFSWYAFNGQISSELEDEVIAWWQMNLPPTKRTMFLAQALSKINRYRLSDEILQAVKQPTIIIQGEKSFVSPGAVEEVCEKLSKGQIFVVKGAPEQMNIIPQYASVVDRVYTQFLARVASTTSITSNPRKSTPCEVRKAGLARLAIFENEKSIANRDSSTTLSFSLLPGKIIGQVAVQYEEFAKTESEAFHALDKHGKPIRKFSERHVDEWTPDAFHCQYMTPVDRTVTVSQTVN